MNYDFCFFSVDVLEVGANLFNNFPAEVIIVLVPSWVEVVDFICCVESGSLVNSEVGGFWDGDVSVVRGDKEGVVTPLKVV